METYWERRRKEKEEEVEKSKNVSEVYKESDDVEIIK
jgi:hypothetical protein